jgi:polysaccharide export outer membrane protein
MGTLVVGRVERIAAAAVLTSCILASTGCTETDGWLWDPSKVGRWERTPTTTPILSRLTSIEGPADEYVQYTDPQPEDLIPEAFEYRVAPGDTLNIVIWNLPNEGDSNPYRKLVDTRGMITLPQLGQLKVSGETVEGAKRVIADAMKAHDLVNEPVIDFSIETQRDQRFSVIGGVYQPGPFMIPAADFRLLEALTAAGGPAEEVLPAVSYIYVIRQIPLEDRVKGRPGAASPKPPAEPPPSGENLIDIINNLSKPGGDQPAGDKPPSGAPGVLGTTEHPRIGLIEGQPTEPMPQPAAGGEAPWVFLNGQWVRSRAGATVATGAGSPNSSEQLVTQRVIRIPVAPLVGGDARYNIVIRPGDVIRLPRQPTGIVFVGGEVVRAGTYQLTDQLTITAAIIAAGGLGPVAVPERVDLTRHIGHDRLATIRLNLRAIYERTHPDIYLRANDQINVGTSFWATPLAIIRNGFRATYGFGFLLDRNFGPDVFGPEPVRRVF